MTCVQHLNNRRGGKTVKMLADIEHNFSAATNVEQRLSIDSSTEGDEVTGAAGWVNLSELIV